MDKRMGVIIGAGPAGLTAAWELVKNGLDVTVFEKYSLVGGIARTEEHKGYRFDIGGHRFFTMVPEVRFSVFRTSRALRTSRNRWWRRVGKSFPPGARLAPSVRRASR